jgi:hypothetical protein
LQRRGGHAQQGRGTRQLFGANRFGPAGYDRLGCLGCASVAPFRNGAEWYHAVIFVPTLQVMPWPNPKDLSDHEIRAIYEYLKAVPCIQGNYPGEPADRCQGSR